MEQEVIERGKALRRKLFLWTLLIVVVLIAVFSLLISPAFSVGTVSVAGNRYLSEEEVYEIAGIPPRTNIFRLQISDIETRLRSDLRIEQAQVDRRFPASVVIRIVERRPVAYLACDYGYVEVDRDGVILAAYRTMPDLKIPIVTGVTLENLYIGDHVKEQLPEAVLVYLSRLDEAAIQDMSEINVGEPSQWVAYTTDSVQIRLGGVERMEEKAAMTEEFLAERKRSNLPVEYIDFNFTSPYIKFKNR